MFVRSLGRKVLAHWVVKEVRMNMKLEYEPKVFVIMKEHLILRFCLEVDYGVVLKEGLWFIVGQLFWQWRRGSMTLFWGEMSPGKLWYGCGFLGYP